MRLFPRAAFLASSAAINLDIGDNYCGPGGAIYGFLGNGICNDARFEPGGEIDLGNNDARFGPGGEIGLGNNDALDLFDLRRGFLS